MLKQSGSKIPPLRVNLKMDDCKINMQIDTGTSVPIISEDTYRKNLALKKLVESSIKLQKYSKDSLPVVGAPDVLI